MSDTFSSKRLNEMNARLDKLTPDTPGKWGKMSATQMVGHLIDAIEVTLGRKEAKDRLKFFPYYFIFLFVVYVLPVSLWPKGVRTLPEYNQLKKKEDPKKLEEQVKLLKQLLLDFNATEPASIKKHPAWGNLSKRQNRDLLVKHIDFHFRQFGI